MICVLSEILLALGKCCLKWLVFVYIHSCVKVSIYGMETLQNGKIESVVADGCSFSIKH